MPVALVKTGSTGWRVLRYYTGQRDYVAAGPPPLLLRWLGPLVVLTTLGVLGTGLALIALGPQASHRTLFDALGQRVDATTLHQALFIGFAVAVGLHILVRLYPATVLAAGRTGPAGASRHPGGVARLTLVAISLLVGAVTAVLVVGASGSWHAGGPGPGPRFHGGHVGRRSVRSDR